MSSRTIARSFLLAWLLACSEQLLVADDRPGLLTSPWAELRWRTDYNAARKEAAEKSLPVLIDFGTADCFWCKKLDETTFRDPRIVALLNERIVPLKVDAEREVHLANHLRIESYPTLVLANADGKIVGYLKGYQDAETFHGILQRVLAGVTAPEWMQKDMELALKKVQTGEYADAIPLLRRIVEDGKGRPLQQNAQKYLEAIEVKASERLAQARELEEKGRPAEAIDFLEETLRFYPGMEASRQAKASLARIREHAGAEKTLAQRAQRATELLAQAREFHRQRDLVPCIDRCSTLLRDFIDLPEGQEASVLLAEIKANPVLLQQAAETLSERLGEMYLALAEMHLNKGQPQRAEFYLQRVVLACPGSRQAESAQLRLTQLQSIRPRSNTGLTIANDPN
jgi:thioredoxin-like negative regulator of GroEL